MPAEEGFARGAHLEHEAEQTAPGMALEWLSPSCGVAGSCVQVAHTPDGRYAVRDGKAPETSPVLFFSSDEWEAFVAGVKAGEFG